MAGPLLGLAWFAGLAWWELRRPLRRSHDDKAVRDFRNLIVAATAGPVVQLIEAPVALAVIRRGEERGWGLLRQVPLPPLLRSAAAIILLDYTLYLWHVLTHRVPLLWRFHEVHHIDREMDASTALRFHFGEMLLSVPFRAAQAACIGPSRQAFAAWQSFLFFCILFHHSNVRLPPRWERAIAHLIATPRLHGIHHSIDPEEVNSNWSSGFTVWDWLHGTLRTQPKAAPIELGVPGHRDAPDLRLANLLPLPFTGEAHVPPASSGPVRQSLEKLG